MKKNILLLLSIFGIIFLLIGILFYLGIFEYVILNHLSPDKQLNDSTKQRIDYLKNNIMNVGLFLIAFSILSYLIIVITKKINLGFSFKLSKKNFLIITIAVFCVLLFFQHLVFLDFPKSGDEYAYLLQAKIFATGKLSVPSHELKDFFNFPWVINDGKVYSQYPFGFPLLLALGFLIKMPWLINPLIGVFSLILIYFITKKLYDDETALIAFIIALFSTFFLVNSSTYFSQPFSLLLSILFFIFYYKMLKTGLARFSILAGISLGCLFITRPYTAFLISLPYIGYSIYFLIKNKFNLNLLKNFSIIVLFFTIFFAINAMYNFFQTGNQFLSPYQVFTKDTFIFGFSENWGPIEASFQTLNTIKRLFLWISFPSLFFIFFAFNKRTSKKEYLFLLILLSLVFGYMLWNWRDYGDDYGPRYYYEIFFGLVILIALGIRNFVNLIKERYKLDSKKYIALLLVIIIIINIIYVIPITSMQIRKRIIVYKEFYDKAKSLNNSIVFIEKSGYPVYTYGLVRNNLDYSDSALIVRDLGENNTKLMNYYKNRTFYKAKFNNMRFKIEITLENETEKYNKI